MARATWEALWPRHSDRGHRKAQSVFEALILCRHQNLCTTPQTRPLPNSGSCTRMSA